MPDGDLSEEEKRRADKQAELTSSHTAALSEKKNGSKLPDQLVISIALHLAIAGIETDDVDWEDEELLTKAAKAGWKAMYSSSDWPELYELMLSRWTGHAAAAKKGGETGPLGGGPSASLTSPKFEKESAARKELVEEHGLGGNALRKGIEACSNQGLTPGAVCALLLSLYVGRTVDESEVKTCGYKFGEDPKTSELVIKVQKATKGSSVPKTLPRLWEIGSFDDMQGWFNDLVRDFTDDGFVTESSLVAQFWSRTISILGNDGKKIGKYLSKYFDKVHTGRGIPVFLDHDIMAMLNAQSSGVSKEDFSEHKTAHKELKKVVDKLVADMNTLKQQVGSLKTKVSDDDKGGGKGDKGGKCNYCGEHGHKEKDCLNKKADKKKTEEEE